MENDDPFFCIDAGLSWPAVPGASNLAVRDDLIKILRRCGIRTARERLSLASINHERGTYDWETDKQFDTVRGLYARDGVRVLDMLFSTPAFHGATAKHPFPQDVGLTAEAWEQVARKFHDSWAGAEMWNEPDLIPVPADQYVPLVKAAAFAQQGSEAAAPVIGGVFASPVPGVYHDACVANGMLDAVDAVSFHCYESASRLGACVAGYRAWLAKAGKPGMPLWLTEAGRAWPVGPGRPPRDADAASAGGIAALATEARAHGIARFFPFYYQFYEEGAKNFGMMARDGSPLRSMAAYVHAARVLNNLSYLGDLPTPDDAFSVRVFGASGASEVVIVIYLKTIDASATISLAVPVSRLEGADGRALRPSGGRLPVPDGLGYAWAQRADLAGLLKADTPASRLSTLGAATPTVPAPRAPAAAVVLSHPLENETAKITAHRYLLDKATAKAAVVHVRAANVSSTPQHVTLRLELPDTGGKRPAPIDVDLAPARLGRRQLDGRPVGHARRGGSPLRQSRRPTRRRHRHAAARHPLRDRGHARRTQSQPYPRHSPADPRHRPLDAQRHRDPAR